MSDTATPHKSPTSCCSNWNLTLASWLVRLAAAALLLISGMDKFKSTNPPYSFAVENWYGSEAEKAEKKSPKWAKIVNAIFQNSGLDNGDRLPKSVVNFNSQVFAAFGLALPVMFLLSGVLIALGLFRNFGYFLGGITWLSLVFGQISLPEPSYATYLLFYAASCLAGLLLSKHDRFTLDGLFSSTSAD